MQIIVTEMAMIENFTNVDYDTFKVCTSVSKWANENYHRRELEKIADWKLYFQFTLTNANKIYIYTRGRSNATDKYKEITAHVPIPLKSVAQWGVSSKQHVYKDANHLAALPNINNFLTLEQDIISHNTREGYLEGSMLRIINFCFSKGFTVNGITVRTV